MQNVKMTIECGFCPEKRNFMVQINVPTMDLDYEVVVPPEQFPSFLEDFESDKTLQETVGKEVVESVAAEFRQAWDAASATGVCRR